MPPKSTIEISLRAKMERKADKNFTWTDDEVALIFSVILDCKTEKSNQAWTGKQYKPLLSSSFLQNFLFFKI